MFLFLLYGTYIQWTHTARHMLWPSVSLYVTHQYYIKTTVSTKNKATTHKNLDPNSGHSRFWCIFAMASWVRKCCQLSLTFASLSHWASVHLCIQH